MKSKSVALMCRLPHRGPRVTSQRRTGFQQWLRDEHRFRSLPPPPLRERGTVLRDRPFYFELTEPVIPKPTLEINVMRRGVLLGSAAAAASLALPVPMAALAAQSNAGANR